MSSDADTLVSEAELRQACAELSRRLYAGEPTCAEDFLRSFPKLASQPEAAVELIYTEFVVREELGQQPRAADWLARFPGWRDRLERLFEIHAQMNADPRTRASGATTRFGEPTMQPAIHRPGFALADYELLAEIGRGGMGVVYKARQRSLERTVAVKMILAGEHAGAEELARFQAEAQTIAQLQHPHIVQVHEIGADAGHPFFVLEFVGDGSLDKKLAGMPLTARNAAQVVETLARAVHVAHQRGIVHRDLKPSNVLLSRCDRAHGIALGDNVAEAEHFQLKITDFGLAKRLDVEGAKTQTGQILGTPSYMAPEQVRGEAVGPAIDVYALGAILYELLTGRPPFRAATSLETVQQVLADEPVAPARLQPLVPRDLETICLRCLEKEADKRYATALGLAEDLRRFLDDRPIQARPPGLAYRFGKLARRNRALVAAAASIGIALVGTIVMLGYSLAQARNAEQASIKAQEETRARLAESHAGAARLATQRGQWRQALANYDEALKAGYADSMGLQLDRVRALDALSDPATAKEVAALAERPDLGDREGEVLLLQGSLLFIRDSQRGLELIRRALSKGLRPADQEYARAHLAETTPDAIAQLERALAADPYHHQANSKLGLLLVTLGRLDEARAQITAGGKLFPDDPSFKVQQAMLHALADEMTLAHDTLDKTRSQFSDEQIAVRRILMGLLNLLCHLDERDPVKHQLHVAKGFALIKELHHLAPRDSEKGAQAMFQTLGLPPVLARGLGRVPEAFFVWVMARGKLDNKQLDALIDNLTEAVKVHPDGLIHYVRGGMLVLRAEKNDPRWEEAEQAFLTAAATPSMARVHRTALTEAVRIEAFLAHPNWPRSNPAVRKRFADNLRKLMAMGPLPAKDAAYFGRFAESSLKDLDLARHLLAEWERSAPADQEAMRKRAEFEMRVGAHYLAIEATRRVLKTNPSDAQAVQLRQEAIHKLRDQAKSLQADE